MVETVITKVGILNVGSSLFPFDNTMIFSIASRISCTEAKLITTERITMAIGSNLVRPTTEISHNNARTSNYCIV